MNLHGSELYPAWTLDAACRGSKVADWAFGVGPEQHAFIAKFCSDCPVKAECLEYGAGHSGVWGGKTSPQRAIRRPRKVAECGTKSGYQRHLRNGEGPCEPCRTANTESSRRQYGLSYGKPDPKPTGRCGTYAGYQRHWARGEHACVPCMDAQREYSARRRAG